LRLGRASRRRRDGCAWIQLRTRNAQSQVLVNGKARTPSSQTTGTNVQLKPPPGPAAPVARHRPRRPPPPPSPATAPVPAVASPPPPSPAAPSPQPPSPPSPIRRPRRPQPPVPQPPVPAAARPAAPVARRPRRPAPPQVVPLRTRMAASPPKSVRIFPFASDTRKIKVWLEVGKVSRSRRRSTQPKFAKTPFYTTRPLPSNSSRYARRKTSFSPEPEWSVS